jgi:hypothetical protein
MRFPKGLCPVLLVMVSGTVAFTGQGAAGPAQTPSQGPRPIASLSPAERNQLPDGTQVTLPSGKIVTLGMLRAWHTAHTQAFTAASSMGRTIADKLSKQTPASGQAAGNLNPPAGPSGTSRAGTTRSSVDQPPPHQIPVTQVGPVTLVAFQPPPGPVPWDYLNFCNAAQATVCLYFPADASCFVTGTTGICDDYMVTDAALCSSFGGTYQPWYSNGDVPGAAAACRYSYPLLQRRSFAPTGPAAVVAVCEWGHYKFDPKGEVDADAVSAPYRVSGYVFSTPPGTGLPNSCVVQVRLPRTP